MKYKEYIEQILNEASDQENSATLRKESFLNDLFLEEDSSCIPNSLIGILKEINQFNETIYIDLIRSFLEIYLYSSNTIYQDKAKKCAKEKIKIVYKNNEESENKLKGMIIIRAPLNQNNTALNQNDENISQNKNILMDIDYYNGKKYEEKAKNSYGNFEKK